MKFLALVMMALIGATMAAPLAPKKQMVKYQPIRYQYQTQPIQYQYQYQTQPIQYQYQHQTQPIQLVDSLVYQDIIPTNTQLLIKDNTVPVLDDYIIQDVPVVDLIWS